MGMTDSKDTERVLTSAQIRLIGSVDEAMYAEFRNQLNAAPKEGTLVIALTTLGATRKSRARWGTTCA